ncbi:MAG: ABC transporter substrate-binding protein [Firmicutes bacterium]|nr:ABC transporter substrate-binding protein [Bacillota bacterium]
MKKSWLGIAASALLATSLLLSSCAQGTGDTGATGTEAAAATENTGASASTAAAENTEASTQGSAQDKSPITLDWYINESWFQSPEGNLAHQLIQDQTGINVNFIAPVGDPMEKLNAMIASNTLPDMVTMGWWFAEVQQLSTPDYTYSYNELDKMAPGLLDTLDKKVVNWYKSDDGNTYCYPCNSVSPADIDAGLRTNRTFLVRKDIYQAIGSPDMRTPDGFIKALADAKAKYPTALNGEPLIPIGFAPFTTIGNTSLEDMLLEFLAVPREIDGLYYPVVNGNPSPDYISWLKTFRLANEKGLLSTDIFIDDRTQIEEKIQQGRYFALLYQAQDALNPIGQLYKNNPDSCYIAVDGPANSKLDPPKLSVPGYSGWEVTFVTKNAKNPERAAQLIKWGQTDDQGQVALYLGQEGVTYDMVNGKPVIKPEVADLKNADMGAFKQKYNTYNEYWMFAKTKNIQVWQPAPVAPFDQYAEWQKGKSTFYGEYDNVAPPADSDEAEIGTRVNNKWGEVLPKLLQAKTDKEFDTIWQGFDQFKKDNNYEQVLQYNRKKIVENKAKLQ